MPSFQNVVLCAVAQLVLALCVGLPLARRLVAERSLALALAPALGWAAFSALALPILSWTGFSLTTVTLLCGVAAMAGGAALLVSRSRTAGPKEGIVAIPAWAYVAAALLAVAPALGVWPKLGVGGLVLADPMFDHSKVAIIDDIVRLGLPPGNPFFGEAGGLAYYYLWHLSAAVSSALLGTSGWEADIALTWFTAFAALSLMMGLAVRLSGRRLAAFLVVLLSLAGSLGPILRIAFTPDFLGRALSQSQGPQSWIFQASWVPQHMASASCVVLAVVIMSRLTTPRSWPLVPLLAVVAVSGFESSAWVGGVVFAVGAAAIGIALLLGAAGMRDRLGLVAKSAAAAALTAAIAFPFLHDEFAATAARHLGLPIAFRPYAVLGPLVPEALRRGLDLPAYWLVLLVIEFPAIVIAGAAALAGALAARSTPPHERRLVVGLGLIAGASFGVPWLFASTIANNDLGWRGVLPGVLVLTAFAAAGLARWLATAPARAAAAIICLALGIPGGLAIVEDNAVGREQPSAAALAETPQMWAAVRRHAAADERVANNPLLFAKTVQWPVDISWALFADRRSCFAGWNLARAFVPLPEPELDRLERLFDRVFAGTGSPQDSDEIATRYDCRIVVLTSRDGAWDRDPFAGNPHFQLVEERAGRWRIYRVVDAPREKRSGP